MALFCRRLRLEIDLQRCDIAEPVLSTGYRWMEWSPELLNRHAAVKYRCFEMEKDGQVFPSLRSAEGCQRLMDYITTNSLFVPNATWLLVCDESAQGVPTDCGTIQGLASYLESGAIQNVGIVPEHRGRGLGRALVQAALRLSSKRADADFAGSHCREPAGREAVSVSRFSGDKDALSVGGMITAQQKATATWLSWHLRFGLRVARVSCTNRVRLSRIRNDDRSPIHSGTF